MATKAEKAGGRGKCQVCGHAEREAIDQALATRTLSAVATLYDIGLSSLHRHKVNHPTTSLVVLPAERLPVPDATARGALVEHLAECKAARDAAKATGNLAQIAVHNKVYRAALGDLRAFDVDAELLELKRKPPAAVNFHATQAWVDHRAKVLEIAEKVDPSGALHRALAAELNQSAAPLDVDLARALDPANLAFLIGRKPSDKPDQWQLDALTSRAPRALWVCHRQAGKSTVAALLALHEAIYKPGSTTLVISAQRQSNELFRKVLKMYAKFGKPVPATAEKPTSLELENGSRVIALPANPDTNRGFTADLVVVDESAHVTDEMYSVILPMVATTGGRILALGTPAGRRGWFFEAWEHGGATWERVLVTADQCAHFDPPTYLEDMRLALLPREFQQEFYGVFLVPEAAVFMEQSVNDAFVGRDIVEPLEGV